MDKESLLPQQVSPEPTGDRYTILVVLHVFIFVVNIVLGLVAAFFDVMVRPFMYVTGFEVPKFRDKIDWIMNLLVFTLLWHLVPLSILTVLETAKCCMNLRGCTRRMRDSLSRLGREVIQLDWKMGLQNLCKIIVGCWAIATILQVGTMIIYYLPEQGPSWNPIKL
jgi:hypothetical protein